MTVAEIAAEREAKLDAIRNEFWEERWKLARTYQRKIEAVEREYRQAMYNNLHRAIAA